MASDARESWVKYAEIARNMGTPLKQGMKLLHETMKKYRCFSCSTMQRQLAKRKQPTAPCEAYSESLYASVCLADISGFTRLSARLSAEQLKAHINEYFTMLLTVIRQNHGDVIKFLGDAVLILWPVDKDASEEVQAAATTMACLCALQLLKDCGNYDRGVGEDKVELRLHCGVVCGVVHTMCVGEGDRWEYIVSGEPLKAVGEAESEASTGECCLSPEAYEKVSEHFEAVLMPKGSYRLTGALTPTSYITSRFIEMERFQRLSRDDTSSSQSSSRKSSVSTENSILRTRRSTVSTDSQSTPYQTQSQSQSMLTCSMSSSLEDELINLLTWVPKRPEVLRIAKKSSGSFIKQLFHSISASSQSTPAPISPHSSFPLMMPSPPSTPPFDSAWKLDNATLLMAMDQLQLSTSNEEINDSSGVSVGGIVTGGGDFVAAVEDGNSIGTESGRDASAVMRGSIVGGGGGSLTICTQNESNIDDMVTGDPEDCSSPFAMIRHIISREAPYMAVKKFLKGFLTTADSDDVNNEDKILSNPQFCPILRNFVHNAARAAIENGTDAYLPELRHVVTIFVEILEMDDDLNKGLLDRPQAALSAMLDVLKHFEGSLRQYVVDDKGCVMIAAFGLSDSSHEDNCVRAVEVAVALRPRFTKLGIKSRIGISEGKVYCGVVGSITDRCEYAMMGLTVNLAARLMCKCAADEIRVSETVHEAACVEFDFLELDRVQAKGFANLVRVFRPEQRANNALMVKSYSSIFVGQREVLHIFMKAVKSVSAAHSVDGMNTKQVNHNHAYIIQGGPGSGKTRLAGEILKVAKKSGWNINPVVANASAAHISTPYNLVRQLLDQIFDLKLGQQLVRKTRTFSTAPLVGSNMVEMQAVESPAGAVQISKTAGIDSEYDGEKPEEVLSSGIRQWMEDKGCSQRLLDEKHLPDINYGIVFNADSAVDLNIFFKHHGQDDDMMRIPSSKSEGNFLSLVQESRPTNLDNRSFGRLSSTSTTANRPTPLPPNPRADLKTGSIYPNTKPLRRITFDDEEIDTNVQQQPLSRGSQCDVSMMNGNAPAPSASDDVVRCVTTMQLGTFAPTGMNQSLLHRLSVSVNSRDVENGSSAVGLDNGIALMPVIGLETAKRRSAVKEGLAMQNTNTFPSLTKTNSKRLMNSRSMRVLNAYNLNVHSHTLVNLIPLLGDILSLPFAETPVTKKMSQAERVRVREALIVRLLLVGIDAGYNLILVDNMHQADMQSLLILLRLLRCMTKGLFIGVRRVVDKKSKIARSVRSQMQTTLLLEEVFSRLCHVIDLPPLTTIDVKKIMRNVITEKYLQMSSVDVLSDENVQKLHTKGNGSPLHCLSLAKELRRALAHNTFISIDALAIAHTDVVARIDQLSDVEKNVLKTASIIGERFLEEELRYTLDTLGYESLVNALDSCLNKFIVNNLIVKGHGEEGLEAFSFTSQSIHQAVYRLMIGTVREKCHGVVAEYMEVHYFHVPDRFDDIVYHYIRSDAFFKKIEYLVYGAVKADQENRHQDVCQYYGMLIKLATGLEPDLLLNACSRKVAHDNGTLVHPSLRQQHRSSVASEMTFIPEPSGAYAKWVFRNHVINKLQVPYGVDIDNPYGCYT